VHQCRGDGPRTRACAEKCLAISTEHGFSFWHAGSTVMSGWALAACGEAESGISRLRRGLHAWNATGSVTYRTYYLGLLVEVLTRAGQRGEARQVLEEARELARQTGEGLYEAELHRLAGALELPGDEHKGAEHFRRALDAARRQEARALELRAAVSLT